MDKVIQKRLEYAYQRKSEAFRIGDWERRDYWDSQIRLIEAQQQDEDERKLASFPVLVEALEVAQDELETLLSAYERLPENDPRTVVEAALALAKGEK